MNALSWGEDENQELERVYSSAAFTDGRAYGGLLMRHPVRKVVASPGGMMAFADQVDGDGGGGGTISVK